MREERGESGKQRVDSREHRAQTGAGGPSTPPRLPLWDPEGTPRGSGGRSGWTLRVNKAAGGGPGRTLARKLMGEGQDQGPPERGGGKGKSPEVHPALEGDQGSLRQAQGKPAERGRGQEQVAFARPPSSAEGGLRSLKPTADLRQASPRGGRRGGGGRCRRRPRG